MSHDIELEAVFSRIADRAQSRPVREDKPKPPSGLSAKRLRTEQRVLDVLTIDNYKTASRISKESGLSFGHTALVLRRLTTAGRCERRAIYNGDRNRPRSGWRKTHGE